MATWMSPIPSSQEKRKLNRAVFLDLNGTIVLPLKQDSLDELRLMPGSDLGIARLLAAGFLCPVVTVQARVAKGLFTEAAFRAWFIDFFGKLGLDLRCRSSCSSQSSGFRVLRNRHCWFWHCRLSPGSRRLLPSSISSVE